MPRQLRRPVAALVSAGLLIGTAGIASAAPPKSFDAAFCLYVGGGLQTTVTWSGYRVDTIVAGQIDEFHDPVIVPVDPAARSGSVTIGLPYDDAVPHVSASILLGKKVWESVTVESTGLDFPNLPRC